MNIGIKYGYPRLQRYFGRLVLYIQLCRPFTGLAPLLAGIFGSLTCLLYYNKIIYINNSLHQIIYVAVTLMLTQFVGQIINQVCDIEIDKINKPYRPLPRGLIEPNEAMGLAWLLGIIALARAFTVTPLFGLFISIIIFFAAFYNLEPFRIKMRNEWLALFWMAFSRGYLSFITIWSAFGNITDLFPHVIGIIMFLWCLAYQGTKDFTDYIGDKKFGVKTLVTIYGVETARWLMALLGIISIVFSGIIIIRFLPARLGGLLYFTLLCLNALQIYQLLFSNIEESRFLENTRTWHIFYLGLGLLYIVTFIGMLML